MENTQEQNRFEIGKKLRDITVQGLLELEEYIVKPDGREYRSFTDVLNVVEEKYGAWIRALYYFSKIINASYHNSTDDIQNAGLMRMCNSCELGEDECDFIIEGERKTTYLNLDIVKRELGTLKKLIEEEEPFSNTRSIDNLIKLIKIKIDMENTLDRNSKIHKEMMEKFNNLMEEKDIELDWKHTNIYFLNPMQSEIINYEEIEEFEEYMGDILNGNEPLIESLESKLIELFEEPKKIMITLIIGDILVTPKDDLNTLEINWPENQTHPYNTIMKVEEQISNAPKDNDCIVIRTYNTELIKSILLSYIKDIINLTDNKFHYKNSYGKELEIDMSNVKDFEHIDELKDLFGNI